MEGLSLHLVPFYQVCFLDADRLQHDTGACITSFILAILANVIFNALIVTDTNIVVSEAF